MLVKQLIEQLSALDQEATVISISEEGTYWHIDRACPSEDPPGDGSAEVWIVHTEDEGA